jgi:hypothetical protein
MSTTKYIINSGNQEIDGTLSISGDLNITGTVSTSVGVYRALLTHTGVISGSNIYSFNLNLIVGETYTITNYVDGDDFSNIANIQAPGTINATGSVFIATGEIPNNWSYSSELTSSGNLVVDVLENTLGFDISWAYAPNGNYGYYYGFDSQFGPMYNRFPKRKTEIIVPTKYSYDSPYVIPLSGISTLYTKDGSIFIDMYSPTLDDLVGNSTYFTPVEIKINKDLDTTPVTVYGINRDSFPYSNPSVDILSNGNEVETIYDYENETVNDIYELVAKLNSDLNTSYLGSFSVNEDIVDGLILTTTQAIKNQFSPNGTMSFEAFNN